jgi:hypothetical protein
MQFTLATRTLFCLASLLALGTVARAEVAKAPPPKVCPPKGPPKFRPKVIYTARPPAQVNVDIVSWGVRRETQSTYADPTKVTITGLPRAARARLRVQQPSKAIDLSLVGPKKQPLRPSRLGALRERIRATSNLRTVWTTDNAAPEIASGEIANTWQAADKVLPVNQPYRLDWSHAAKASGGELTTIRGQVQGLPTEHQRTNTGRYSSVLTTKSGTLAPRYEGFIQRKNLLKTDAYSDGKQAFVKVKGVRALPNGASYTVRNLQTGETVSGVATRYGSFNARVPVATNAEQQLELTIQLKDKTGIETTLTRSLGRVTFARGKQAGREIAYHYVEAAGRKLPTISANVKGTTVDKARRRPLAKPEVTVRHQLIPGQAERGTQFNFYGAKNQTVLSIGNISADSTVEVLQQVAPTQGKRPVWKSFGRATIRSAPDKNGRHEVRFDGAILGHTPLKLLVRRPGSRKTHVIRTSMPDPGQMPIGNFGAAERVYKAKYATWLQAETVKRTVAHHGRDGRAQVKVHGKLTAPASARVSIVNETTGAESRPKLMREAFATTLAAEPGHRLALKVQFANGSVETQHLGIVPDAVEPSYRPSTGLHLFPFTQNHIR